MNHENGLRTLMVLVAAFSGSLVIASVLASKIINIFGVFVPAGVFAYCITFICTDVISEIWGKRHANTAVIAGFLTLAIAFLLIQISLHWTAAPFWNNQSAFRAIVGMTPRIILGSIAAYIISQLNDVWLFHFIKEKTGQKHLWLRNNISTTISQFIDSVVFITIAFYGVMPIWPLVFGQWMVKMVIAIADTPIVYCLVWSIRSRVTLY